VLLRDSGADNRRDRRVTVVGWWPTGKSPTETAAGDALSNARTQIALRDLSVPRSPLG
jgi:hypothetical protein